MNASASSARVSGKSRLSGSGPVGATPGKRKPSSGGRAVRHMHIGEAGELAGLGHRQRPAARLDDEQRLARCHRQRPAALRVRPGHLAAVAHHHPGDALARAIALHRSRCVRETRFRARSRCPAQDCAWARTGKCQRRGGCQYTAPADRPERVAHESLLLDVVQCDASGAGFHRGDSSVAIPSRYRRWHSAHIEKAGRGADRRRTAECRNVGQRPRRAGIIGQGPLEGRRDRQHERIAAAWPDGSAGRTACRGGRARAAGSPPDGPRE